MAPHSQRQIDDYMGALERSIGVTIAFVDHCRLAGQTKREDRRFTRGVEVRLGRLDIDDYEVGCIFGNVRVGRDDHGNGFTDVADEIPRKRRLTIRLQSFDRGRAIRNWFEIT